MKKQSIIFNLCLIVFIIVTGCRMPAPADTGGTQIEPEALFTAAALTADALESIQELDAPTSTPPDFMRFTESPLPTNTPTPSGPLVATVVLPPTTQPGSTDDIAEFLEDVTIPDGTTLAPFEDFTKTWRIKNAGTTTWTTEYALVFISGALMRAPASVPLPREVPPGESVDISVDFIAPAQEGIYQSFWILRNASGETFGVGFRAADPLWVTIGVSPALGSQATATLPSGEVLSNVSLRIDQSQYSGTCPHTFRISVEFVLKSASTVTLLLEGGSSSGKQIELPPAQSRTLDVGTHTVDFELIFSESFTGWLRAVFTQPKSMLTDEIPIVLTCQ